MGRSLDELAERMKTVTKQAQEGLGSEIIVGEGIVACADDTRGVVPCPWPHPGVFRKTVITVTNKNNGKTVRWSLLSLHMIEHHGFFEGKGASFRLDPEELVAVVF